MCIRIDGTLDSRKYSILVLHGSVNKISAGEMYLLLALCTKNMGADLLVAEQAEDYSLAPFLHGLFPGTYTDFLEN